MPDKSNRPFSIMLLVSVSAALMLFTGCHPWRTARNPNAVTEAPKPDIPFFSAEDITGVTYTGDLFADAEVAVINVWSTESKQCIRQFSDIPQLADNYAVRGLQVLTVSGDSEIPGRIQTALDIIGGHRIRRSAVRNDASAAGFAVLRNNGSVSAEFPAGEYPITCFMDSGRNIPEKAAGVHSCEKWAGIAEGLLQ